MTSDLGDQALTAMRSSPERGPLSQPLLALRQLVEAASLSSSPRQRVAEIVSRVKASMGVEVCSLYLTDGQGNLTLAATEGLNPQSVGRVRLRVGEGMVGRIAQTQHFLNAQSAKASPYFRYFPETGEERLEGFLGAPIVHQGRVVGVLVVEQAEQRRFSEAEESFLVTAAAHLGTEDPEAFLGTSEGEEGVSLQESSTRSLKGVAGAPGIGIGRVRLLSTDTALMEVTDATVEDVEVELERFALARTRVLQELRSRREEIAHCVSPDAAELFSVYEVMLETGEFCEEVEAEIRQGHWAPGALRAVVAKYAARFEAIEDPYLRARVEDVRGLAVRLYAQLQPLPEAQSDAADPVILVGDLVGITEMAEHVGRGLAGIVSKEGSALAHTAVLAKALGIPAVMGVGRMSVNAGESMIVDGSRGRVVLSPPEPVLAEFRALGDAEHSLDERLASLRDEETVSKDGVRLRLLANAGLLADVTPGLRHGAEGIGLYRSEIPFLVRASFPSEEEQVAVYREVIDAYEGKPVHMRTLDIGGDKPLPYYPFSEGNPALGWRGVRFTLDHTAVLMTQLRAMLRAAGEREGLGLILPMVSAVDELERFVVMLESAMRQLVEEGIAVRRPRIGVMAEVPGVASILSFMAPKIDFISIGSNDLSQYVLAVDRSNPKVARCFDHLHLGVIEAVENLVEKAGHLGLEVSVCGEMAADPYAAVLLLGMGVTTLSMSARSIPRSKCLLRSLTREQARAQLRAAKNDPSPMITRRRLHRFLEERGLGELLYPQGAKALEEQAVH